jgi:hypothetical protein
VPSGSVRVTTTLTRSIVLAGRKPGKDRRAALHWSPWPFTASSPSPAPTTPREDRVPVGRHGITIKETWGMRRPEEGLSQAGRILRELPGESRLPTVRLQKPDKLWEKV